MPTEFIMMDGQGYLPYDARGPPAPQMPHQQPQRHIAHYVVGPAYDSQPAPPTFTTPQYQGPTAFQYLPYHSPSPTSPVGSPFHNYYQERQLPQLDQGRMIFQRDSRSLHEMQIPSPSTRSESLASNSRSSVSSYPTANAKTITDGTINPGDRVSFDTEVDELMKAIQRKKSVANLETSQGPTPVHTPGADHTEPSTPGSTAAPAENKPNKKWVCDSPSCNKSFIQKNELAIHRRTHTGAKPYDCTQENCALSFSQRGNLKTHLLRHTGEKPFPCSLCGRGFIQLGIARSHEKTHKGLKPFVCKLDNCNKTFARLGNMKTHQNSFHKETIKMLIPMFAQFSDAGNVPEEYQKLFEYFSEHYKNSNKGIKGRGKARTVATRKPKCSPPPRALSSPTPQQPLPQIPYYHNPGPPSYAGRAATTTGMATATATWKPLSQSMLAPSRESFSWQSVVKDEPVEQLDINYLQYNDSTFMNHTVLR